MADKNTATEIDVELAADPAGINKAMDALQSRFKDLQKIVQNTVTAGSEGAEKVADRLGQQVKAMESSLRQIQSMAKLPYTDRDGAVTAINQQKAMARATIEAGKFAKTLENAESGAEALQARLNAAEKAAAKLGTTGGLESRKNEQLRTQYAEQLKLLKDIDAQQGRLESRAARSSGNFAKEIAEAKAAQAQLENALTNPRRVNFSADFDRVKSAQTNIADALAAAPIASRYNRSLIPGQNAAAIAAGTADALKLEIQNKINKAEQDYLGAQSFEKKQAFEILEFERTRLSNLEQQVQAKKRAEEATKHGSILPKGGLGTVVARTAAYAAAGTGIFALVNAFSNGADAAIEFEDSLGKLQAIAGATDGQMVQLTKSILDVGKNSRFSLTELAEAATTLAQAGVATSGIESSLQAISTLAAASGSTLSQSVDVVTSTLAAFNLQANEASRVSDSFTAALNRSKLTVGDIAAAISTAGSTAAESNMSYEELTAAIGAMAQAGVRGSKAATGLRQLLIDFTDPSKKLSDELRTLGITFEDIDVKTRGLPAVLETLTRKGFGATEAFKGLENRSAAAFLTLKRQIPLMQELTEAQTDDGVAAAAAAKATDTLTAQWQEFKNTLSRGSFSILEALHLKEAIKGLNEVGERLAFIANYRREHNLTDPNETESSRAWETYQRGKDAIDEYNTKLDEAATKTKNATEAFDNQQQKVSSLDEAINRMVARQGDLKDGSQALSVETASMSHQFEGLAGYLDGASLSFGNLLKAAQAYRVEQLQILQDQAQIAAQAARGEAQVAKHGAAEAERNLNRVFSDRGQQIDPKLQGLVNTALRPNGNEAARQNALAQLRDQAQKLDPTLRDAILQLVNATRTMVAESRTAGRLQRSSDAAGLAQNPVYVELQNRIDRLGNSPKDQLSAKAMIDKLNSKMSTYTAPQRELISGFIDQLSAKLSSPGGLNSSASIKTDKGRTPTGTEVAGLLRGEYTGANVYSYGNRSLAEQQRLYDAYKAGKGPLAAKPGTSNHGSGLAVDMTPLAGVSLDDVVRYLESKGLFVSEALNERDPKSGRSHWHIGWKTKPSQFAGREQRLSDRMDAEQAATESLQARTANNKLTGDLKDIKDATSLEMLRAAEKSVNDDFEAWAKQTREAAVAKLQKDGIGSGSAVYKDRMAAVEDQIKQKREDLDRSIADGFSKYLDAAFKHLEAAFEHALAPGKNALARLQGRASGFDMFSNQGRVPDYVRTLNKQQQDRQSEANDREELAKLPGQISNVQSLLGLADTQQQVDELTKALDVLTKRKEELDERFSVAIPPTFAEGLRQAVDAIRGANDFGMTFGQSLTMNIGGALDNVRQGLQGFFSDIFQGSSTVLGAFGNMAKGIMKYMEELAAKAVAEQIFGLLLSFVPSFGGVSTKGLNSMVSSNEANFSAMSFGRYKGGPIGYSTGGEVMNGSPARDSVHAVLAKGEFVMQKTAVDSVGRDFMAKLNSQGSQALKDLKGGPTVLDMRPPSQEMKVFVVAPESKPSMGPNDVLLTIQDDLLKGGMTKQLVRHISQGG